MVKKTKYAWVAALALVSAIGLAGCGKNEDASPAQTSAATPGANAAGKPAPPADVMAREQARKSQQDAAFAAMEAKAKARAEAERK